jgi:hypothetical protein
VPSGSHATSSAARAEPKADSSAPKLTGPNPDTDSITTHALRSDAASASGDAWDPGDAPAWLSATQRGATGPTARTTGIVQPTAA